MKLTEGTEHATEALHNDPDLERRLKAAPHCALDSQARLDWLASETKKAPKPREE